MIVWYSENYQNNGCRATPIRPNIASGLGTTAADGIPSTEMYSGPHLQQQAANKDGIIYYMVTSLKKSAMPNTLELPSTTSSKTSMYQTLRQKPQRPLDLLRGT
jgi:hypothetical protein